MTPLGCHLEAAAMLAAQAAERGNFVEGRDLLEKATLAVAAVQARKTGVLRVLLGEGGAA